MPSFTHPHLVPKLFDLLLQSTKEDILKYVGNPFQLPLTSSVWKEKRKDKKKLKLKFLKIFIYYYYFF